MKRKRKEIKVFVSSEHNGALKNIHYGIRTKLIPFSNNILLHIDSHPDLSVPLLSNADIVLNPHLLYEALETSLSGIAEFITPLLYVGHISKVIWVKPSWSKQIKSGKYQFSIGKHKLSNQLKVTLFTPYFTDDGSYCKESELITIKNIELEVIDFKNLRNEDLKLENYILDVCLDFFSVHNPFLMELKQLCNSIFDDLMFLFVIGPNFREIERIRLGIIDSIKNDTKEELLNKQNLQENEFKIAIKDFFVSECSKTTINLLQLSYKDKNRFNGCALNVKMYLNSITNTIERKKLINEILELGPDLDLPHHESSESEINFTFKNLESFLKKQSLNPSFITLAKSSSDGFDYTPPTQVANLYEKVIKSLRLLYTDLFIRLDDDLKK